MRGLIWGFRMGVVEVKREGLVEEMGLMREERHEDWRREDMGFEVGGKLGFWEGFGLESEHWVSGFNGEWWWWWWWWRWIRGGFGEWKLGPPTDFCNCNYF